MLANNPLRIAIIGTNCITIPPIAQNIPPGWSGAPETIVHQITEGLARKGHDVTLFASGDSKTSAKLVSVVDTATWKTKGIGPHESYERLLLSGAYRMAQEGAFDIIHSHLEIQTLPFAPLTSTPTVSTLHSPLDTNELHKDMLFHYKNTQYFVSISNDQRKPIPDLQYAGTVYNGIDIEKIPFSQEKDDYLIFAGRIVQEKGVAEAIELAKSTNNRLLIFGSVDETKEYWQTKIKPMIDEKQIVYKGMVPQQELYTYISRAKAFVFPLQWEEPFGLTVAEAMACGTPVLTLNRGSMAEIVEHAVTGFISHNLEEMIETVKEIGTIQPEVCRKHVEKLFSMKAMVDGYEAVYRNILSH